MKNTDPRDAIFHDEDKARAYFEAQRWPDGKPFCPHCGSVNVHRLEGASHRPGLIQCNDCLQAFTVTVGSVMESSHLPLTKWALAFHKMAASKKGISAKQMQRELNLGSYRTAWFLTMRVREAMSLPKIKPGRIGGSGKVVESDETFIGGKAKNVHKNKPIPKKHAVHALVERGGHVRASHVADVSAKTLRKVIAKHVAKGSTMNTDDALAYYHMSKEFAAHGVVNHSAGEYVSKDGQSHIQSAEAFFAILKRGVMGSFHSVSEQHLQRYCDEFAFRWNTRSALGVEDAERARLMVQGAIGKRLTYRQADKEGQAQAAPKGPAT
ncbi:MAG: IS1595 family transposase [Hyphomicrobiaceae bacterium]